MSDDNAIEKLRAPETPSGIVFRQASKLRASHPDIAEGLDQLGERIFDEHERMRMLVLDLDGPSGTDLTIRVSPGGEVAWQLEHRYYKRDDDRRVRLVNEWNLLVRYDRGELKPTVTLSMHVIIPEKLGTRFLYGADISPGAKTFFELTYEANHDFPAQDQPGEAPRLSARGGQFQGVGSAHRRSTPDGTGRTGPGPSRRDGLPVPRS